MTELLFERRTDNIDPMLLMQIYRAIQENQNVDLEFTTEVRKSIKIKQTNEEKHTPINNEHFIHMLIEDSHHIAEKIRDNYGIKPGEIINIDGFLSEYKNDEENSSDLLRKVRDDN